MTELNGTPVPPSMPAPPVAPPPDYAAPSIPGRTLGIVGLILAFVVQLVGLILSIVALIQSRKAGVPNTPAVVGIIVSAVLMVVGIIIAVVVITTTGGILANVVQMCQQLGSGVHEVNGVTYTCS